MLSARLSNWSPNRIGFTGDQSLSIHVELACHNYVAVFSSKRSESPSGRNTQTTAIHKLYDLFYELFYPL